jgi:hypothetical protein
MFRRVYYDNNECFASHTRTHTVTHTPTALEKKRAQMLLLAAAVKL